MSTLTRAEAELADMFDRIHRTTASPAVALRLRADQALRELSELRRQAREALAGHADPSDIEVRAAYSGVLALGRRAVATIEVEHARVEDVWQRTGDGGFRASAPMAFAPSSITIVK